MITSRPDSTSRHLFIVDFEQKIKLTKQTSMILKRDLLVPEYGIVRMCESLSPFHRYQIYDTPLFNKSIRHTLFLDVRKIIEKQ